MPKAYTAATGRLLKLAVGRSCVLNTSRPDRYLATARKHAPDGEWVVETRDGGKVVTRVR